MFIDQGSVKVVLHEQPYATTSRTAPAASDRWVIHVSTLCLQWSVFYVSSVENLQRELHRWLVKGTSKIGHFQMESEVVFCIRLFFLSLIGSQGNTKEEILISLSLSFSYVLLSGVLCTIWAQSRLSQIYFKFICSHGASLFCSLCLLVTSYSTLPNIKRQFKTSHHATCKT